MAVGNQIAIAVNVAKLHEEIKRKKEELEYFAYTISHDLKSPSVGIVGMMNFILQSQGEGLDEKVRRCCQSVKKATDQILTLVTGINEYISATGTPLKLEKVSSRLILQQVQDELSQALEKRNTRLLVPEEDPEIFADELAMTRVFRNLINNALKYGGQNLTKITICYHSDEHAHIFSVNNDGREICREDCSNLFEMFRRLPSSRQTEGSGLGLTIVRDIIKAHGGKAWVESDSVNGTTFYVSVAKDTLSSQHISHDKGKEPARS
jgi:signal transduction histidine kinase